jgi:uncharacterized phage-associated protein
MKSKTITQAVFYLLSKIGQADKIQILKWIYLSDKYHLVKYGRTITGDQYYAMEYGPVGSTVKDVLELNKHILSRADIKYATDFIENIGKISFKSRHTPHADSFDYLSETDKEALDYVIKTFGKMNNWQLTEYTHQYPEWKRHEHRFRTRTSRRECIDTKELFSLLRDDYIKINPETLNISKEIFRGHI